MWIYAFSLELSSDVISTEEEWFIGPEVPTLKQTLRVTTQTPYGGPAAQSQVMGWGATCPSCGAAFVRMISEAGYTAWSLSAYSGGVQY